jgi:hypothetical protein
MTLQDLDCTILAVAVAGVLPQVQVVMAEAVQAIRDQVQEQREQLTPAVVGAVVDSLVRQVVLEVRVSL